MQQHRKNRRIRILRFQSHWLGTTILIISHDEQEDIIKIAKSLEHSGLLLKGATETTQKEVREQNGRFFSILLGKLVASFLGNLLTDKGTIGAGERTVRPGYGSKRSLIKDF